MIAMFLHRSSCVWGGGAHNPKGFGVLLTSVTLSSATPVRSIQAKCIEGFVPMRGSVPPSYDRVMETSLPPYNVDEQIIRLVLHLWPRYC